MRRSRAGGASCTPGRPAAAAVAAAAPTDTPAAAAAVAAPCEGAQAAGGAGAAAAAAAAMTTTPRADTVPARPATTATGTADTIPHSVGRGSQLLLATSQHDTSLKKRGFEMRWVTWRAKYGRNPRFLSYMSYSDVASKVW
jgi:hypothetical protein